MFLEVCVLLNSRVHPHRSSSERSPATSVWIMHNDRSEYTRLFRDDVVDVQGQRSDQTLTANLFHERPHKKNLSLIRDRENSEELASFRANIPKDVMIDHTR